MGRLSEYDDLEQSIIDSSAKQMQDAVDRELVWGLLETVGYTRVKVSRSTDNYHAIDIRQWLRENCKSQYQESGAEFLFESEQDANWFKLRWL